MMVNIFFQRENQNHFSSEIGIPKSPNEVLKRPKKISIEKYGLNLRICMHYFIGFKGTCQMGDPWWLSNIFFTPLIDLILNRIK